MEKTVVNLDAHPKRLISLVRRLASDLACVDYSENINELLQARKVSMRAIWTCLEEGDPIPEHSHIEENGTYMKLSDVIAGIQIYVDILVENTSGANRLIVLWAEELEEE